MTEAAKQARREYKRQWNRRNRDKVQQAQARYWERKAQAVQDQQQAQEAQQQEA